MLLCEVTLDGEYSGEQRPSGIASGLPRRKCSVKRSWAVSEFLHELVRGDRAHVDVVLDEAGVLVDLGSVLQCRHIDPAEAVFARGRVLRAQQPKLHAGRHPGGILAVDRDLRRDRHRFVGILQRVFQALAVAAQETGEQLLLGDEVLLLDHEEVGRRIQIVARPDHVDRAEAGSLHAVEDRIGRRHGVDLAVDDRGCRVEAERDQLDVPLAHAVERQDGGEVVARSTRHADHADLLSLQILRRDDLLALQGEDVEYVGRVDVVDRLEPAALVGGQQHRLRAGESDVAVARDHILERVARALAWNPLHLQPLLLEEALLLGDVDIGLLGEPRAPRRHPDLFEAGGPGLSDEGKGERHGARCGQELPAARTHCGSLAVRGFGVPGSAHDRVPLSSAEISRHA